MTKPNLLTLTLVLLFLFIFPNPSQADHGRAELSQAIDGYQVELVFAAGHPQTGSNDVAIKLHSEHGQPLTRARVKVSVSRPEPAGALPHQDAKAGEPDQILLDDPHGADDEMAAEDHPQPGATGDEHTQMLLDDPHGEMAAPEADEHAEAAPHNDAGSDDHAGANSAGQAKPAHGEAAHGEPAEVALAASPTTDEYTGQVRFSDTGEWHVKVHFDVDGETKETTFSVVAAPDNSRWLVIGGFLGLNAMVVLAAAISKRKYVSTKKGKAVA